MERIKISVDADGYTVRSESGVPAEIAMRWTDLDAFKKSLVLRLCGVF